VVGSSLRLEVSVLDEQGNVVMPPPVTWVSSDSAIASVASDGMVHLKAAGRAEVRARYKDQADSALVVVREAPVSSVEIAPDSTNLTVGNAIQFHATVLTAEGDTLDDRPVEWTSSDQSTVLISATGLAAALTPGRVTITATSESRSGTAVVIADVGRVTQDTTAVTSVLVEPDTASVEVGKTVQLVATPRDARNRPLAGRVITWNSTDATKATVSAAGRVIGVAVGTVAITATSENHSATALITVKNGTVVQPPGAISGLAVTAVTDSSATISFTEPDDGTGHAATYDVRAARTPIDWGTAASVAAGTCRTPVAGGTVGATRTCTIFGLGASTTYDIEVAPYRGTLNVNAVFGPLSGVIQATTSERPGAGADYDIVEATWTQGVQATDGSIPVILGGNAAVVNVLVRSSGAPSPAMQFVLRLFDGGGSLIRADTVSTAAGVITSASPTYDTPSLQFLVRPDVLRAGLQWQVVRDPRGLVRDDATANDVFPRSGMGRISTTTVPPLRLRFVPLVLAAHDNTAPTTLDPAGVSTYTQGIQKMFPVGAVTASVGSPFTTSAYFGTPPEGGTTEFFDQVLSELESARMVSADPTEYWMGIAPTPSNYFGTQWSGMAYIGTVDRANPNRWRTATSIAPFSPVWSWADIPTHELGHNFGRMHAPCGNPSGVDPAYPDLEGRTGSIGHDVWDWAFGTNPAAWTEPATLHDIMGYCNPKWASPYTYRGIMDFRQRLADAATAAPFAQRVPILMVRGKVDEQGVSLEPAFTVNGWATAPDLAGGFMLLARDAQGGLLFTVPFTPRSLDNHPSARHFVVGVPLDPSTVERVASLEVTGPAGSAMRTALPPVTAAPGVVPPPQMRVQGNAVISCPAPAAGIVILDGTTGAMLTTASASSAAVSVPTGTPISVGCSDGVHTTWRRTTAP
jgi:uncharacterized protein YjdB